MSRTAELSVISSVAVALLLGLYALRLYPMDGRRAPVILMVALTLAVAATILGGGTLGDAPVP